MVAMAPRQSPISLDVTPAQLRFLQSTTRGTIFKGGVGAGKTLVLCRKAILSAYVKRRFCLVSFTYRTLKDVVLYTLREELETFGLTEKLHYNIRSSDMIVEVLGAEILLRSADSPDHLRGLNIDDFGIDEARELKDRSTFDIMIARIRKREDAHWYIATTTKGRNWVYELEGTRNTQTISQTTLENPFLPQSYIDELLERYTSEFARQELYAEIVDFGAGIIQPGWFKVVQAAPLGKQAVRYWDVAVSIKEAADYSAGALCSIPGGRFTVHDIVREKWQYPDLRKRIIQTAILDGTDVIIGVEDAGTQRGFIDDLKRLPELRPYTIRAIKPHGDKLNRAMPWAARAELGDVDLVRGKWVSGFLDECSTFTADDTHEHDDMIDAVSGGYQVLTRYRPTTAARVRY